MDCPAGTFTSYQEGNSICTKCDRGEYSEAKSGSCTPCPPGEIAFDEGSTSCEVCPAGTISAPYNSFGGNYYCAKCSKGTYSKANSYSCIDCPEGTYAPKDGASSCKKCPSGKISQKRASFCYSK